jgi:hypothetical protein
MELTGCGPLDAAKALADHKEIWRAVDALLPTPVEAGAAYIPPRPVVDSGLSPEQAARCAKGRWLQDQITAVVSVAHSGVQAQPDQLVLEGPAHPVQEPQTPTKESPPSSS